MPSVAYRLRLKVWLHPGAAAWHFATLPKRESRELKGLLGESARGWGSLPVRATVGKTTWETSLFPDSKAQAYLLPLKASVRKAEGIGAGAVVEVAIEAFG